MRGWDFFEFIIMSNNSPIDLKGYLSNIDKYLNGDLNTFHKICAVHEKMKMKQRNLYEKKRDSYEKKRDSYAKHKNDMNLYFSTPSTNSPPRPDHAPPYEEESLEEEPLENKQEFFNLTIPITLSLFAVADVVGYLVRKDGSPTSTYENLKEFFNLASSESLLFEEEYKELLNKFRHGMTHGYFPKLLGRVHYETKNKDRSLFFLIPMTTWC